MRITGTWEKTLKGHPQKVVVQFRFGDILMVLVTQVCFTPLRLSLHVLAPQWIV